MKRNATYSIANKVRLAGAAGLFFCISLLLTGCGALDKPVRPTVYDFGPGALGGAASPAQGSLPAIALADVETYAALDSTAVFYRLAYADAQQLRPYAQTRWSMVPAQMIRQRLRDRLGQRRAVLNPGDGTVLSGGVSPWVLRLDLEEFSQVFDAPASSTGLIRVRATVVQPLAQGERLLGQRTFTVQRPAATPDAIGGVRALAAASDGAIEDIEQWLAQLK